MNMMKKLVCGVVFAAVALGAASVLAGSTSPYGEGGEVTFVGDNKDAVHTFTATGDNTFELFSEQEVWFLVVGGGGAGGNDCAGGGGAGGFVESNSVVLAAGTYTVTVGAGGQPTSGNGVRQRWRRWRGMGGLFRLERWQRWRRYQKRR